MPVINPKDLKAVTLSFDKFGFLRNVTAEEAGEFLQVILGYAMTGKMPEFKDKYQKMYYQSYLDVITEQMAAATKRANNLRKSAKERSDVVKEAKRIIAKQGKEASLNVSKATDKRDATTNDIPRDVNSVSSPSLFDNNNDDLTGGEQLSLSCLTSLGVKPDAGSFNAEPTWNAMSDADKHLAIAYAKEHYSGNVKNANAPYVSQFLKMKPWGNA